MSSWFGSVSEFVTSTVGDVVGDAVELLPQSMQETLVDVSKEFELQLSGVGSQLSGALATVSTDLQEFVDTVQVRSGVPVVVGIQSVANCVGFVQMVVLLRASVPC
jgi:hypothetical protein